MFERKGVIVYFRNPKVLKTLKPFGNIAYYHKKRKYAVIYIDTENADDAIKKMQKIRHVRKVEYSLLFDEDQLEHLGEEILEHSDEDAEEITGVK